MSAGLGIRIGTVTSVAALHTDDGVDVENPSVNRRSALDLRPGAAPSLAALWERQSRHLLSGFADRVGDPVALIDEDGRSHLAEDLYATATRALVAEMSAGVDSDPSIVLAHPTGWSAYTVEVLGNALARVGLEDVTLVPDSLAAMRWLDHSYGPSDDGLVVIYDLGASALDVTLMRTGADAGVLGSPLRSQEIGGGQFDHAIMQYVLDTASSTEAFEFDPFDPDTVGALVELRARCGEAKEALSLDTATSLTLELPGVRTEVRLVRSEIEDLLRQPLLDSVRFLRDAVLSAGLDVSDVSEVLLTGGSSSIPLVAELISSELRVPVIAGPRPELTVAIGAALLGTEIASTAVVYDEPATVAIAAAAPRPTSRPAPTPTPVAAAGGMSGRKKAGIVSASVLVLALLAGGGLSLGTAMTSDNKPAESSSQTSSVAETSTPGAAVAGADAAATSTTGAVAASDGTTGTAEGAVVSSDGSVVAVDPATGAPVADPAAGSVAAPGAVAPAAPAPAPAAPQAPAATVPSNPVVINPPAVNIDPPDVLGGTGKVLDGAGNVVGSVAQLPGNLVGGLTNGLGLN